MMANGHVAAKPMLRSVLVLLVLIPFPCVAGDRTNAQPQTATPETVSRGPEQAKAGAIRITEVVPDNKSGQRDEDGDFSDWIELHNPGTSDINLEGWSLTYDPEEPKKWVFPKATIPAGGYLVVFASGKDRRPSSGGVLHTNFCLNPTEQYLGLYGPPPAVALVSDLPQGFPFVPQDWAYAYLEYAKLGIKPPENGHDEPAGYEIVPIPTPGSEWAPPSDSDDKKQAHAARECSETPDPSTEPRHWSDYQSALSEILRRTLHVRNPEGRQNGIEQLALVTGNAAQIIRILWWVSETDSVLRKELLTQWLCGKEEASSGKEQIERELLKLVRSYKPECIDARAREIHELRAGLDKERARRGKTNAKHLSPAPGELSGCEQLDHLNEAVIFCQDADKRRQVYATLPTPENYEGGNDSSAALLRLLWAFEPDRTSRKILERGIFKAWERAGLKLEFVLHEVDLSQFANADQADREKSMTETLNEMRAQGALSREAR